MSVSHLQRMAYRLVHCDCRTRYGQTEPGIREKIIAAIEKSILEQGIKESLEHKIIFFNQQENILYLLQIPNQNKPDILSSDCFKLAFSLNNFLGINLNELSENFKRSLLEEISRSKVKPE